MGDRTAILRAIGKFSPPPGARQPAIGTFSANSGTLHLAPRARFTADRAVSAPRATASASRTRQSHAGAAPAQP
jgi:hypothetical protein